MWTPQIESVEKTNDKVRTIVSFTSDIKDEQSFRVEYFLTDLNQLKRAVQSKIDSVTKDFTFADELAKVIGKPFDTTIITTPPNPDELARIKYFKDLGVLNLMIEGIKNGIRKDTDPDYLAQLDLVKSEFKPEYEQI